MHSAVLLFSAPQHARLCCLTAMCALHCVVDTAAQHAQACKCCKEQFLPQRVINITEQLAANTVFVFMRSGYFAVRGFLPAARYALS